MSISLLINPFESALMAVGSYYKTIKKQSNMKPFDLEKAKQGHPVCTRDGRDVEILKIDARGLFPIVGIKKSGKEDIVDQWMENGAWDKDVLNQNDLLMKPTKKEGWINLYRDEDIGNGYKIGSYIYDDKNIALNQNGVKFNSYIDTIKIEWEE
jgi:hypothetical protein